MRRSGLMMPWTTAMRPSCHGPRCHPGAVARFLLPCASRRNATLTAASLTGAASRTRCGSSWTRSCTPPGSWKQRRRGRRRCGLMPCSITCTVEAAEQRLLYELLSETYCPKPQSACPCACCSLQLASQLPALPHYVGDASDAVIKAKYGSSGCASPITSYPPCFGKAGSRWP